MTAEITPVTLEFDPLASVSIALMSIAMLAAVIGGIIWVLRSTLSPSAKVLWAIVVIIVPPLGTIVFGVWRASRRRAAREPTI